MTEYFKGIWNGFMRYRHLLRNLVERDIKVKYRRSTLGLVWSVLNPLLMMLVMTLVFSTLFKSRVSDAQVVSGTGLPPSFSVYLLSAQLMFNFFSEATNLAMESVIANAGLLKKVYIPKYIFPLEKVIFSFINALFSLIALIIVIVATGSSLSWWALLFPLPMLFLFVFNLGVGLILSALTVFFRDIKHFYGIILTALTYLTPLFYTEDMLFPPGTKMAGTMAVVLRCNPLYWYVKMFRSTVVYGNMPSLAEWVFCIGWAVIALVVGLIIFKKSQDRFILYI